MELENVVKRFQDGSQQQVVGHEFLLKIPENN